MKYKVGDRFLKEIEITKVIEHTCGNPYVVGSVRWSEAALDSLRRPDDITA